MLSQQFEKTMPLETLTQSYDLAQTRVGTSLDSQGEVKALSLNGQNMMVGTVAPVDQVAQNDAQFNVPGVA